MKFIFPDTLLALPRSIRSYSQAEVHWLYDVGLSTGANQPVSSNMAISMTQSDNVDIDTRPA